MKLILDEHMYRVPIFQLGDTDACLSILLNTNVSYVVKLWSNELAKIHENAGQKLADLDPV